MNGPDFSALRTFLIGYARRRWPGLDALIEDLVSDAMRDLWASHSIDAARRDSPADQLRAQAITILRRRVVDYFRRPVAAHARIEVAENLADPQSLSEDEILHRRLLRFTLKFLSDRSAEERGLLLDELKGPLTDAQRKRRQRLRGDLRAFLAAKLGSEAVELLGGP